MQVSLLDAIVTEHEEVVEDRPSAEFSLQIDPRAPERLERLAWELAEAAIAGPTLEAQMEAVHTLSYMLDPIAVPQLGWVLNQGTWVEHDAIEGLGRIANAEAIAILNAAALSHPDPEVRSFASFTLSRLEEPVEPDN